MDDDPLSSAAPGARATTAELDETDRLRHTLGKETFDTIQQHVWRHYIASHKPPYSPGIQRALLVALRAAVTQLRRDGLRSVLVALVAGHPAVDAARNVLGVA